MIYLNTLPPYKTNIYLKMSQVIKYEATNHDKPKENLFSLTPVQAINGVIDY